MSPLFTTTNKARKTPPHSHTPQPMTASRPFQVFTYNFSKLTVATSVLYGYAGVVPLVGWAISKWMFSAPFGLIELICVYGYSLSVFIPASLLCVVGGLPSANSPSPTTRPAPRRAA